MHKAVWVLFASFSLAAPAQSVVTIAPRQCVWRTGDDTAWAAPNLDDSAWRPYSSWSSDPARPHLWLRCKVDLNSLQSLAHPSIQIRLYSPYELYFNGTLIGGAGNLKTGDFNINAIRAYPIPQAGPQLDPIDLVALRITDRILLTNAGQLRSLVTQPLQIYAGDPFLLDGIRSHEVLVRSNGYFKTAIYYGIIGVLAIPLLALYLFDRTRTPLLLLSLICVALAALRINEFAIAALAPYSFSISLLMTMAANFALTFTETPFVFVLARRRIPIAVWALLVTVAILYVPVLLDALFSAHMPIWFYPWNTLFIRPFSVLVHAIMSILPFFAFWPYSSMSARIRPIAILCMIWGVVDLVFFVVQGTAIPIPGIPNIFARWGVVLLDARGIATALLLFSLLVLLFREQRQITRDRAFLAGELQSAGEIQRMLAPRNIDCAPGLQIDVAFHPMREVGGDFYLCRVLPNHTQRVVIGDVSGKGSAAAMTAALLLGGAADQDSMSPSALLSHLNRVLFDSRVGGFATCLCADFAANGQTTLANAGHLSPYLRGEEIATPSGLPLGLDPQVGAYQPFGFTLAPGDTLTFLSDGVVEARSSTGELFGFDRARALSIHPADQIAGSAQAFGQEDDITVLTVTRMQAEPAVAPAAVSFEPALNPVKF